MPGRASTTTRLSRLRLCQSGSEPRAELRTVDIGTSAEITLTLRPTTLTERYLHTLRARCTLSRLTMPNELFVENEVHVTESPRLRLFE